MAKSFGQLAAEFAASNRKQDIRSLKREKEMYSFWRSRKELAIEHARRCKQLGLPELQLKWQHRSAKYDKDAKASKEYIRQLGARIYG